MQHHLGAATVPEVKYRSSGSSARVTLGRLGFAGPHEQLVVALAGGLDGRADDDHVAQRAALVAHGRELGCGLVVDDGDRRLARSMRCAMSRAVHSVVAGMGTTP